MEGRTPSEEMMKSRFWTEMASREEMESGVVVFDKRRKDVVMGLVLTGQLNTKVRFSFDPRSSDGADLSATRRCGNRSLTPTPTATRNPSGWFVLPLPSCSR